MPKVLRSKNDRKAALAARGLTQRGIALALDVDESAVSHVLSGRLDSDRIKQAVAAALGMPVERVFPPAIEPAPEAAPVAA